MLVEGGEIYALGHLGLDHVEEKLGTPSVSNYKSFQESWRVKPSQSLTKIIKRNTKIYDIK